MVLKPLGNLCLRLPIFVATGTDKGDNVMMVMRAAESKRDTSDVLVK